jgi:formylglycine-generating enzyme required for sulfatase activity
MKRVQRFKTCSTSVILFPALVLFSISFLSTASRSASGMNPQGKGGEIKPLPTPTPATKKTTPAKKSSTPARTHPTGASKQPARKAEPVPATNPAVEVAFWETIKTSTDPEDFREYLRKYPNGEFSGLAKNRLKTLEAAQPKTAATPDATKETTPANTSGTNAKPDKAGSPPDAKPNGASDSSKTAPTVTSPVGAAKPTPKPGTVVKNSIGIELVYVPAGSFMMGTQDGTGYEKPVHQVTIRDGFYMGKYEVTQAQWTAVMGRNPSRFKGDNLPVEQVSWYDAQEFLRKLNATNDGYAYRLPSEAEWEYAARAGTTTAYYWGDDASQICRYANVSDQTAKAKYPVWPAVECRDGYAEISPVGSFQPNAWGLYDMSGNVVEWCQDWYTLEYNGAPTDGSARESGEQKFRVNRGGSFANPASGCRSDARYFDEPSYGDNLILGFRVVAVTRTQ